jgi:ribonuclease P protein component
VGFTASRKVGNAVARNRARRRLRAAAAEVLPALAEAGTDYVLVARKATLGRRYGDLVRDLHEALIQLGYQGTESRRVPRRRTSSRGPRASAPGERE